MNPVLLGSFLAARVAAPVAPARAIESPRPGTEPRVVAAVGAARANRSAETGHSGAVTNDLSNLDPEFRSRLDRVIARMSSEFGHTVEVLETYREQGRQEALFAQGRTAPGPVVTWTRNSLHTLGRAADIRIDGSFEECEGYRELRRVAEAEGLHTLGARDPGHVEMSRSGGTRYAWVRPAVPTASNQVAGAVMTRIVATGGGAPSAGAAPTVFSKRNMRSDEVESEEPTEVAAETPVVRVAAAPAGEIARLRVPNEAERRHAVDRGSVPEARADDPGSMLAAVRADAALQSAAQGKR